MSSLLNSFKLGGGHAPQQRHHHHQRDEHGVAELLEAVSQRSMSCSDEERKEIGDMVKRVQNYKKQSNLMERFQQTLALKAGDKNSTSSSEGFLPSSPPNGVPSDAGEGIFPSTPNGASASTSSSFSGSIWGKEFLRNFSKITVSNPLSPVSPSPPESPAKDGRTNLFRSFETAPTIVIFPPEKTESEDQDNPNDDERGDTTEGSSSSSSSFEDEEEDVEK